MPSPGRIFSHLGHGPGLWMRRALTPRFLLILNFFTAPLPRGDSQVAVKFICKTQVETPVGTACCAEGKRAKHAVPYERGSSGRAARP